MNKHKMTLVIMGAETVLECNQWPKGRDEGEGEGGGSGRMDIVR
jgi:hypothetical protein